MSVAGRGGQRKFRLLLNVGRAFYSRAPVAAAVTDLAVLVMSRFIGDG
jgi:hypothetical protein